MPVLADVPGAHPPHDEEHRHETDYPEDERVVGVVIEELGRAMAPGPFVPTVLAAALIDRFYEKNGYSIRPDWKVIDIGAGTGEFVLFAAVALTQTGGQVFAIGLVMV